MRGEAPKHRRPAYGLLVVLVLVALGMVWLQAVRRAGASAYTSADARRWVSEVRPEVERITGRRFGWVPKIRLVDSTEMQRVLYEDALPEFRMLHFRYPLSALHAYAKAESCRNLGIYVPRKRTIYVLPANLGSMPLVSGAHKPRRDEIMRLVVAHGMVRCLQDQWVGTEQLLSRAETGGERLVVRAVLEGHARLVTEECAIALGLNEAFGNLTCTWCEASDEESERGLQERANAIGWRFMIWQEEHGGSSRLWRVLERPPDKTSLLAHPERYDSWRERTSGSAPDYSGVLRGLQKRFGGRKWVVVARAIGREDMMSLYADVDPAEARRIATGTIHAQTMSATDGDADVTVWFALERDPHLVKLMMRLDRQAYSAQLRRLQSAGNTVTPVVWTPIGSVRADCAARGVYAVGDGHATSNTVVAFVGRESTAVGMVARGIRLTDTKIGEIAEVVFERLVPDHPHSP